MKHRFTADFETTTDVNDCRVWAWAMSGIDQQDYFEYGQNIEDFFDFLEHFPERTIKVYFHNLKFDGSFLLNYLLSHGFTFFDKTTTTPSERSFSTLITDMGQFYQIKVYFDLDEHKTRTGKTIRHWRSVEFLDSQKILNMKVAKIAKSFDLPIRKGEIDYKKKRPVGHIITSDELAYIKNDVEIMSQALRIVFNEMGLEKMTIGGNALAEYKSQCSVIYNLISGITTRS